MGSMSLDVVMICEFCFEVVLALFSWSGRCVLVEYYLGFERADCFHLQGKVKSTMKAEAARFSRPMTLLGIAVSILNVVKISNITVSFS